jgi:hypothetical protein
MSTQLCAVVTYPHQHPPHATKIPTRVRRKTCRLLAHVHAYLADSSSSADFVTLHNLLNDYLQQPADARAWAENLSLEQLNDEF